MNLRFYSDRLLVIGHFQSPIPGIRSRQAIASNLLLKIAILLDNF
ncbi:hypothetical protein [Argonema galeatum]|nr:hypothetical protein [Argonema galeatum]